LCALSLTAQAQAGKRPFLRNARRSDGQEREGHGAETDIVGAASLPPAEAVPAMACRSFQIVYDIYCFINTFLRFAFMEHAVGFME